MQVFKQGEMYLLVVIMVIEVGVDVFNLSLMIIENLECLGLVQLYQFRGCVGCGVVVFYCVLFYKLLFFKMVQKCLQVLCDSNDGFVIVQKDFEICGFGELFGICQIGNVEFKVVDLLCDQVMIFDVQCIVCYIYECYLLQVQVFIECWMLEIECYFNVQCVFVVLWVIFLYNEWIMK